MIELLVVEGYVGWRPTFTTYQDFLDEGGPVVLHRRIPRNSEPANWKHATVTIEIETNNKEKQQ